MKTSRKILIIIIFAILLSAGILAKDMVKCFEVVDGDTIKVSFSDGRIEKVRLIGIDTPETKDPRKPVEYFGQEASDYTKTHLEGKEIKLEYDQTSRDKYGRLLAYVFVNGELFNNKIIKEGYAHAYLYFPFKDNYMKMFRDSEKYAREHKLGLWAENKEAKKEFETDNKLAQAGKYIASRKSDVFHYATCGYAKKIKPENRVFYNTREEAIADGKRPCMVCKP